MCCSKNVGFTTTTSSSARPSLRPTRRRERRRPPRVPSRRPRASRGSRRRSPPSARGRPRAAGRVPAVHRDDAERATPGRERPRARVRERRVDATGVVVHYTLTLSVASESVTTAFERMQGEGAGSTSQKRNRDFPSDDPETFVVPTYPQRTSVVHARSRGGTRASVSTRRRMSLHAVATAVYRRFARQIRAHPRHRVKLALAEEVRRVHDRRTQTRPCARARWRSLLARRGFGERRRTRRPPRASRCTRSRRGQRDASSHVEASRPKKVKLRRSSGTGAAEEALLRATYGPLTDLIGVRGVGGEYWSDE